MTAEPNNQEVSVKPTVAVLYSDAGAAALIDALKAWRKEYAPSAAYDEMFANYIRDVEVKNTLFPGGKCRIRINIHGRRTRDDDQYWYEAQVAAGELTLTSIQD